MEFTKLTGKRIEFLEEMVAHYSEDTSRRSVNEEGLCFYRHGDKKCAIGRFIPDEHYDPVYEGNSVEDVMPVLPDNVRVLGYFFLKRIQELHDDDDFWDTEGLTEKGLAKKNHIMSTYGTYGTIVN